jgi:EamA domain-containing membrane protein RarD
MRRLLSSPQYTISVIITAVWLVLYLMAAFYDRSLQGLAQSVTPVMLPVVGFLLGREMLQIVKGKAPDSEP